DYYLFACNTFDGNSAVIQSVLYKWDGFQFRQELLVTTKAGIDCKAFAVDGITYLAVMQCSDGVSYATDSVIYRLLE
ncbi:MAG: hypothetical protein GXY86_04860, partial [Firmicutes bacterium]|nr:hypothetical protein [Bacillota bacterium]